MFDETVFLGGGSGFVSKTVIYSLLGEEKEFKLCRIFLIKLTCQRNISITKIADWEFLLMS
ncbi:MAG: hypothetical protein ACLUTU_14000 [Blautia faecis]